MKDPALLDELLNDVAPVDRDAFMNDYRELAQLAATDRELDRFLGDFLAKLVRLYVAEAGAIWFRSTPGNQVSLRAESAFGNIGLEGELEIANIELVRYALSQSRSFVIRPFSRPHSRAKVANPTDSFVLLGPVHSHGDRIAVVELFLGATPTRLVTDYQPDNYVTWFDQLLLYLAQGIEQRFHGNLAPVQPALNNLEATRVEIEAYKDAIRVSLEITLNNYSGWNFGSLRNNQTFTRQVHELLDANSLRVECPECRSPAILRCQLAGNSKTGVFLYDHYLEKGRTFHGGPSTFPLVKLVAKPPRRRSQ
jgi:hypothetical protein